MTPFKTRKNVPVKLLVSVKYLTQSGRDRGVTPLWRTHLFVSPMRWMILGLAMMALAACMGADTGSKGALSSSSESTGSPSSSVSSEALSSAASSEADSMSQSSLSSSSEAASSLLSSSSALSSESSSSSSLSSTSSSELTSSSSSEASSLACDTEIMTGKTLWSNKGCAGCHGDFNPNADGVFVNNAKKRTIDLFHTTRDFYRDKKKLAIKSNIGLPEFIQRHMLNNKNAGDAEKLSAWMSAKTSRPWCPGEDWPQEPLTETPETGLKHVVFAYGAVGDIPDGVGWRHHDPLGEGIQHFVKNSGWPEQEGFKASLVSLQGSADAFVDLLKKSKNGDVEKIDAIVWEGVYGRALWKGANSNTEATRLFEEFIDEGGGYAGFHSVVYLDRRNEWPFYWNKIMLGKCCVAGHPPSPPTKITVQKPNHPANGALDKTVYRTGKKNGDPTEIASATFYYKFSGITVSENPQDKNYNPNFVVLQTANQMNTEYPFAWAYDFSQEGGGRTFTSIIGNKRMWTSEEAHDLMWREHVKSVIRWVSGVKP